MDDRTGGIDVPDAEAPPPAEGATVDDVPTVVDDPPPENVERHPGPVLSAVMADLDALGELHDPGHRTYAAMALSMARVIDNRGEDEGVTATARLMEVLRSTMAALTRKDAHDGGGIQQLLAYLSTPVRDDAKP